MYRLDSQRTSAVSNLASDENSARLGPAAPARAGAVVTSIRSDGCNDLLRCALTPTRPASRSRCRHTQPPLPWASVRPRAFQPCVRPHTQANNKAVRGESRTRVKTVDHAAACSYRGCARTSGRPGAAGQALALDAAGGTGPRACGLQTCRMASAPLESAHAHVCVTQH